MTIRKHTVEYRLMKWGQWTQEPQRHFGRSTSPFGTIAEMQDNAGIHPDGIRYEIIEVNGDSVSCPPDGGMWHEYERAGKALAFDIQCREVEEAVSRLPCQMRKAIIHTYVVGRLDDPRSTHEVARRMNLSQSTVRESLSVAHQRVSRAIYGAFSLAECTREVPEAA
jgi:hypothetical protein